jgi:hypothetical protein
VLLIGCLRAVVGGLRFRQILSQRDQRRRSNAIMGLQSLMGLVYPLFQLLFNKVNHTRYELPVLAILPIFKLGMKAVFASAASHRVDLIPEQVVFTLDFFDAFYLATFMQTISTPSLVVVLTIDVVQTAIELHELHRRTHNILANLYKDAGMTSHHNEGILLTASRSLCSSSTALREQLQPAIRVRSCVNHTLSHEGRLLLEKIDGILRSNSSDNSVSRSASPAAVGSANLAFKEQFKRGSQNTLAVFPQPAILNHQSNSDASHTQSSKQESKTNLPQRHLLLQETLEVLFASECIVLTEYLEVFVPVLYGTFILAMAHLPAGRYHTELEGVTSDNVGGIVSRMFIYALLEFISFVVLAVITKRNCGIHALYQLAFVLETHMSSVIVKLTVWLLVTLAYRVVHFGMFLLHIGDLHSTVLTTTAQFRGRLFLQVRVDRNYAAVISAHIGFTDPLQL